MRPKKVILCVDDDEQRLSVLKYTLAIHGYRLLAAPNETLARAQFASQWEIDLVLAYDAAIIDRLKQAHPYTPMMLFGVHISGKADAVMDRKVWDNAALLLRVKTLCARKRGPRKGMQRHGPLGIAVAAERVRTA